MWLDTVIRNVTHLADFDIKKKYKHIKCWSLLCSRKCMKRLDFDDIINTFPELWYNGSALYAKLSIHGTPGP